MRGRVGRTGTTMLVLAAGAILSGCASRGAPGEARALPLAGRQMAYDRGYLDGVRQGERDARDGLAFDVARDSDYQKADRGYRRSYRNRDAYRDVYRAAYEVGYKRGFYGEGRKAPDGRRLDGNGEACPSAP